MNVLYISNIFNFHLTKKMKIKLFKLRNYGTLLLPEMDPYILHNIHLHLKSRYILVFNSININNKTFNYHYMFNINKKTNIYNIMNINYLDKFSNLYIKYTDLKHIYKNDIKNILKYIKTITNIKDESFLEITKNCINVNTLTFNDYSNIMYDNLIYMKTVKNIKFGNYIFGKIYFPPNLEYVKFGTHYDGNLTNLPKSTKKVVLNSSYDHHIHGILHSNITHLTFSVFPSFSSKDLILPKNLKNLTLSGTYNYIFDFNIFENTKKLEILNAKIYHNMYQDFRDKLPKTLKTLTLVIKIHSNVKLCRITNNIESLLIMSENVKHYCDIGNLEEILGENIKKLYIDNSTYIGMDNIPDTIEYLMYNNMTNHVNKYPKNLKVLIFTGNKNINFDIIPKTIKKIIVPKLPETIVDIPSNFTNKIIFYDFKKVNITKKLLHKMIPELKL